MHQYSYSDLKLEKMTKAHGQNILSGYKVLIIFHYLQKKCLDRHYAFFDNDLFI